MESRINELMQAPSGKEILFVVESYMNRPLNVNETKFIAQIVLDDGWNFDMIDEVALRLCGNSRYLNFKDFVYQVRMLQDNGCNTFESVKAAFDAQDVNKDTYETVARAFGKKSLSEADRRYIDSWVVHYPMELIIEAANRTISRTSYNHFIYADKILENWRNNNLNSIEDIKASDKELVQKREEKERRKPEYRQSAQQIVIEYPNNPLYHMILDGSMKPCPFCGGDEILLQGQFSHKAKAYYKMVACNTCNAKTRAIKDDAVESHEDPNFWNTVVVEEVKILWNTRA